VGSHLAREKKEGRPGRVLVGQRVKGEGYKTGDDGKEEVGKKVPSVDLSVCGRAKCQPSWGGVD